MGAGTGLVKRDDDTFPIWFFQGLSFSYFHHLSSNALAEFCK